MSEDAVGDETDRLTGENTISIGRVEERLRRAHDTFRDLVDNSPFGLYIVDFDFRLVQVSAGAQPVFANVRPLLGRDLSEVLRIVWPEPFASAVMGHFRHTLHTGEPYYASSTVERRHDIDTTEWYDWKLGRIVLPDDRFGVVCHFYDLSERLLYEAALLEREERLEQALSAADAGSWAVVPATGEFSASDRALQLHGVSPGTQVSHQGALARVHVDDRAGIEAAIRHTIGTGEAMRTEHRVLQPDGSTTWIASHAQLRHSEGAHTIVVGLVQNITLRKEAEELLRTQRTREREIALSLQRALLPSTLPDHPFVEIGHRYSAGGDGMLVGGDWYDAIAFDDGRIGIMVGDVVGHGLDAAAAMGKLRTAAAALAPERSPQALLEALDAFTYRTQATDFATLSYALYDPATGELEYASAGHPPILVVSPGGAVRQLNGGVSPPLGGPPRRRCQARVTIERAEVLVLYSDGLIERRTEGLDIGLDRLADAVRTLSKLPAQDICDHVYRALCGDDSHEDDVVVVAVRVDRA